MPRSNRSARRSSLFSLSARLARQSAPRDDGIPPHDGDDCPMCIAERSGRTLSFADFVPRPDGGPPPIFDGAERFLVSEARKALATVDLAEDEAVHFIQMGNGPDGMETASFSVERDGAVYWTSPSKRVLVARIEQN
jgi:hypothetical protein